MKQGGTAGDKLVLDRNNDCQGRFLFCWERTYHKMCDVIVITGELIDD